LKAIFQEFSALAALLWAGWQVLALLSIVHVVMTARGAAVAWAWAMSMLALPLVAVPLYWIAGRRRFEGYAERMGEAREACSQWGSQPGGACDAAAVGGAVLRGEEARYGALLEKLGGERWTEGNEISLLVDGEEAFAEMFRAIEEAESYVLAQFFVVKDDEIGNRFRALLEAKARQGLEVCLLYDRIGSYGLTKRYLGSLLEAGVDARRLHSIRGSIVRLQANFRNHRKILVCDGKIGFTGGLNVGDEYVNPTARYGAWRDTMVRLRGPSVLGLQSVFLDDCCWAGGRMPDVSWDESAVSGNAKVLALATGPICETEGGADFFMHVIGQARRRLWIASPFFITDESVRFALRLAAMRGVDVRILIPPATSDSWALWLIAVSHLPEMASAGVRVFGYEPGFLHQKVVLVDECLATVGSANFDNRSMRLNFEITAVALCRDFASGVEEMLLRDFARSRELGASDFLGRPWWFRAAAKVACLASPVL